MIVHISLAKYKEQAAGQSKQENIEQGKILTEALKERIPSLKKVIVGIGILHGPKDYDVASYSEYEDMEAVKATVSHPAHDELAAFLEQVTEVNHTVTYEVAN